MVQINRLFQNGGYRPNVLSPGGEAQTTLNSTTALSRGLSNYGAAQQQRAGINARDVQNRINRQGQDEQFKRNRAASDQQYELNQQANESQRALNKEAKTEQRRLNEAADVRRRELLEGAEDRQAEADKLRRQQTKIIKQQEAQDRTEVQVRWAGALDNQTSALEQIRAGNTQNGYGIEDEAMKVWEAESQRLISEAPNKPIKEALEREIATKTRSIQQVAQDAERKYQHDFHTFQMSKNLDDMQQEVESSHGVAPYDPHDHLRSVQEQAEQDADDVDGAETRPKREPEPEPVSFTPKSAKKSHFEGSRNGVAGWEANHFSPGEFASKGNGQVKADKRMIQALDFVREKFGKPIRITSGYRDPAHNKKIGGAKNSRHVHGDAVDIDLSGYSDTERQELATWLLRSGFTSIGSYNNSPNMIHVDMRDEGRAWHKGGSGDYAPLTKAPKWAQGAREAVKWRKGYTGRSQAITRKARSGSDAREQIIDRREYNISGPGEKSRAQRRNNPGNVKVPGKDYGWSDWVTDKDKDGYAKFKTPAHGAAAQIEIIARQGQRKGSLLELLKLYAPANDPDKAQDNQPVRYANTVAKSVGIQDINADLGDKWQDPEFLRKLAPAMAGVEDSRVNWSKEVFDDGMYLYARMKGFSGGSTGAADYIEPNVILTGGSASAGKPELRKHTRVEVPEYTGPMQDFRDNDAYQRRRSKLDMHLDAMPNATELEKDQARYDFDAKAAAAWLGGMIEANPAAAKKHLDSGKFFDELTYAQSSRLDTKVDSSLTQTGNFLTSGVKGFEAAIQRRQNEIDRELTAQIRSKVVDDISSLRTTGEGVSDYSEGERAVMTPKQHSDMNFAKFQHTVSEQVSEAPAGDLGEIIESYRPAEGQAGFAESQRRFEYAQKAVQQRLTDQAADPAGYAVQSSETTAQRWDKATEAASGESPDFGPMQGAVEETMEVQRAQGVPESMIRALPKSRSDAHLNQIKEADEFEGAWNAVNSMQTMYGDKAGKVIEDLVADGLPEGWQAVTDMIDNNQTGFARQLAKVLHTSGGKMSPDMHVATDLAARGRSDVASTVAAGRQRRLEISKLLPGDTEKSEDGVESIESVFSEALSSAFAGQDDDYSDTMDAVKSHYAASITPGEKFNPEEFRESIKAVTGGVLQVNGTNFVAPDHRVNQEDFDGFLEGITAEDLPNVFLGTVNPAAITPELLADATFHSVSPGRYEVRINDKPLYQSDEDGARNFVLDFAETAPKVKARADALVAEQEMVQEAKKQEYRDRLKAGSVSIYEKSLRWLGGSGWFASEATGEPGEVVPTKNPIVGTYRQDFNGQELRGVRFSQYGEETVRNAPDDPGPLPGALNAFMSGVSGISAMVGSLAEMPELLAKRPDGIELMNGERVPFTKLNVPEGLDQTEQDFIAPLTMRYLEQYEDKTPPFMDWIKTQPEYEAKDLPRVKVEF